LSETSRPLDRSTRPLTLTGFGQTYYEGAKALLDQYHELEVAASLAIDGQGLSAR